MATSAKTVLKIDDTELEAKLKSVSKYYKETFSEIGKVTQEYNKAEKRLTADRKELIKQTAILREEKKKLKTLTGEEKKTQQQYIEILQKLQQEQKDNIALQKIDIANTKKTIIAKKQEAQILEKQENTLKKETKALQANTSAQLKNNAVIDKQSKSTENLANQTIRYLRWAGTIAGVVYATQRAWDSTLGTGIQINKMVESNTFGISALTSANTRMVDSLGNSITPMEKFIAGQAIAKDIMQELREEALKTPATFAQLTEIYQQATGQTLAMGDAFGGSVEEINKNTVQLAQRFSNIAGAIGQPMDRVKEEIRSALTGNVSTDSIISTMIFGSPTEANKAIKEARQRSNGLKELFDLKFEPFDILATTKSYEKGFLQMQGAWQRTMGDMVEKSGMFQDITETFYEVAQSLTENSDDIVENFDDIYEVVKDIVGIAENVAIPATAIASYFALAKAIDAVTASAMRNPYIAGAVIVGTAGYSIAEYFSDENKRLLELSKVLNTSVETLSQQPIDTIRKGKKLLESEYNELTSVIYNLQKDIADDSFFESDENQAKDVKDLKTTKDKLTVVENHLKALQDIARTKNEERVESEKTLEIAKEQAKLIAELAIDRKVQEDITKFIAKEEDKIVALMEKKKLWSDDLTKNQKKLSDEKKREKQDTIAIAELQRVIANNRAGISEVDEKIARIKLDRLQKEEERRNNIWVAEQALLGVEVKRSDLLNLKIQAEAENYALTTAGKEEEESRLKILKLAFEYQQAINNEKKKDVKEDDRLDEDWARIQSEHYLSMVESQISLSESASNWGSNLEGVAGTIADLSSSMAKFDLDRLKSTEAQAKLDIKYAKIDEKIWEDEKKAQTLAYRYIKEQDKIKKKSFENEMDGYAGVAGASANFFNQESDNYKTLHTLEMALQFAKHTSMLMDDINNAKKVSASTTQIGLNVAEGATKQATEGDPYTATARVLAMVALLAGIAGAVGVGGSSGGGSVPSAISSDTIAESEFNTLMIEMANEPILERLDRMVDLLEIIGLEGTAGRTRLAQSATQYEMDTRLLAEEIIRSTQTLTLGAGYGTATQENIRFAWENQFSKANEAVGDSLFDLGGAFEKVTFDANVFRNNTLASLSAIYNQGLLPTLSDWTQGYKDGVRDDIELGQWAVAQGIENINKLQEVTHEYIVSLSDVVDTMSDAKDTFKELYDDLTGTTTYEDRDLAKAKKDVEKLLSDTGLDFATYLEKQISIISKVEKEFGTDISTLFLSQDPRDLQDQADALSSLNKAMDNAFGEGVQSALNFIDSIELYAESILESSNAIMNVAEAQSIIQDDIVNQWEEADDRLSSLSETFSSLGQSIEDTISTLLGGSDALDAQDRLIEDFWNKREELDTLLLKDTNLTESEEARLKVLTGNVTKLSTEIQKASIGDNTNITNELVSELGILSSELADDENRLSMEDKVQELTDTAIEYLGESSPIVEWLKTLTGVVGEIGFNQYAEQKEIDQAYARVETANQVAEATAEQAYGSKELNKIFQENLGRDVGSEGGADFWQNIIESADTKEQGIALATAGIKQSEEFLMKNATPFANGGVVNRPTVSLFGEAGTEAFVPLPDGRTIPVTMNNKYPSKTSLESYASRTNDMEVKKLLEQVIQKLDTISVSSSKTAGFLDDSQNGNRPLLVKQQA